MPQTTVFLATAPNPGAVALLYVCGPGAVGLACRLTGRKVLPMGRCVLAKFADIDEGLVERIPERLDEELTQRVMLMPHAGPRVVQRLISWLVDAGAVYEPRPDPRLIYPEAKNRLEAHMLWAVSFCASPRAVPLLLKQPMLWEQAMADGRADDRSWRAQVMARSTGPLSRLLTPASVVVAGRPNAGKSTLTNRLSGKSASIVADQPGTTRDWVGTLAVIQGVCVRWLDTPGLRETVDPIEAQAITLASSVIAEADVLIAMRDIGDEDQAWPVLPREADLFVVSKADRLRQGAAVDFPVCHALVFVSMSRLGPGSKTCLRVRKHGTRIPGFVVRTNPGEGTRDSPILVSGQTGVGVDLLCDHVLRKLGLVDGENNNQIDQQRVDECWAFCPDLVGLLGAYDRENFRRLIENF